MSTPTVASDTQSVDDVLASIRKLVSDEARGQTEKRAREAVHTETDAPLVLTPELKVAHAPSEPPLVLETPVSETAKPETTSHEPGADLSGPAEEPAPFHDEVALRAIVSEMIREELQGELGTRITRNVRRMVRREIELALKERKLI